MTKTFRVLHVPTAVGGNPVGLARAERRLGIDSKVFSLKENPYGYSVDEVLWPDGCGYLRRELKRLGLIWRAASRYDVIHYNAGTTIANPPLSRHPSPESSHPAWLFRWVRAYLVGLQKLELALMKALGKVIFLTFQGSEARQGDHLARAFEINDNFPGNTHYSADSDREKRRRIALFDRYADRLNSLNPDLLHMLPARTRFLPYTTVFMDEWEPVESTGDRPPVIHAPSDQGIKGTRYILDAVEQLQAEGLNFDFRLIQGLTRQEARNLYEMADLAIDQLLIGGYGGLAVELMALGKPVICYMRAEDLDFLPPGMKDELPIINAEPGTIHDVLKSWLHRDRDEWRAVGKAGRRYVENWHDPVTIARSMIADYEEALAGKQAVK